MLEILYHKGPSTNGIFRKSGNVRMTRLLKEKINQGSVVCCWMRSMSQHW